MYNETKMEKNHNTLPSDNNGKGLGLLLEGFHIKCLHLLLGRTV